ncbi:EAL domain, c-di-GMP-specific phosphodiesterase class I (or its enzymatically inactive variant) [Butyrivibrio sp. INlla18]|uniref:EAL domain-containing protein n=1 Tax=Butyrivibrio sp. INlla18 TaxID=1520806 RepID=UPI00087EAE43|nr:EAL domain-containing protein [Butyrivibrio sp. INlla18]SDA61982.1 EAL domain, c-di-GMP-specific phosphodiesterase class I (or its enzymatically inactive variant) [Butyrivibrio sp. INlla18]
MEPTLVDDLFEAMESHELIAYYQPQYNANTGILVSAEALVRWKDADGNIKMPSEFIPELEKTNAITFLDWFVAEEACKTIKELGDRAVPISVNFSQRHVNEKDFASRLERLLKRYEVDKSLFEVEITETAFLGEYENIVSWGKDIHEKGIKIAIDDFGSGSTSIKLLAEMPVSVLKIDKGLMQETSKTPEGKVAIESIFYLAHRLNLETVAEGVENSSQLKLMQSFDCQKIQGFLFAKPMPKEEFMLLCGSSKNVAVNYDVLTDGGQFGTIDLLLEAIYKKYPLIVYGNLSKNSYLIMKNNVDKFIPSTGSFDELTQAGIEMREGEEKVIFNNTFSRLALLKAYKEGKEMVQEVTVVTKKDGKKLKILTNDYFVKMPTSKDVIIIGFNDIIEEIS